MRYLSVCSGIEAATVAWHPLGWEPAAFSEIEKFPRAVLKHRFPDVPLHGDFTTIKGDEYGPIDLLVGGTPCQSFSIAGLRGGLADDRGNLALEFLKLADRARPRWILWENVPGVISSLSHDAPDFSPPDIDLDAGDGPEDGEEILVEDSYDADESHAFACFLAGLQELGYGAAYRVLDAQYAGVPQRRRRVFVVGYLGDWRRAAAVFFERHSLSGHPAPRREKGQVAPTVPSRSTAGGGLGTDFDCDGGLIDVPVAFAENSRAELRLCGGDGQIMSQLTTGGGKPGQGQPCIAFAAKDYSTGAFEETQIASPLTTGTDSTRSAPLIAANAGVMPMLAFSIMPMNSGKDYKARETDIAQPIMAGGPVGGNQGGDFIKHSSAVRRLTPRECERLQGFPDDWTAIPWGKKPAEECPDGPRYKALGNSMAVPCMKWIGERIALVDRIEVAKAEAA